MAKRGNYGGGTPLWQIIGIIVAGVVVVAFAGYVVTRDPAPPATGAAYTPSPSPTQTAVAVPDTPKVTETDFAQSGIPDDYAVFDTGLNESGMEVKGGQLVHGAPTAPNGASYLETELPGDVQRIGAVAEFPSTKSGSIALVVWEDSLVAKRTEENTLPQSGLHFVASPGRWHLGIIDPKADKLEDIVEDGAYSGGPGSQEFDLFRQGDTVWVVDPSGNTTTITDPRIAEYAGPWANWELYEPTADSVPASFSKVWAG